MRNINICKAFEKDIFMYPCHLRSGDYNAVERVERHVESCEHCAELLIESLEFERELVSFVEGVRKFKK